MSTRSIIAAALLGELRLGVFGSAAIWNAHQRVMRCREVLIQHWKVSLIILASGTRERIREQ